MSFDHWQASSGAPAGGIDADQPRLRKSYPAVPESVSAARHAVAQFAQSAGACPEQVDAIRLAASEAVTNVVRHAYRARLGHLHVAARLAQGVLWLRIADNGCGIHAGRDSDGLGLGLGLITQVSDGLAVVERSSGGTDLHVRFNLVAGDLPA